MMSLFVVLIPNIFFSWALTTLSTFLTLSYNFNIPLTGSLFKFDKEKFKDYILIED